MALSTSTFSNAGGAVSDLFAGFGDLKKAQGAEFEKQSYNEAALFADQEGEFTKQSTAIKETQADREIYGALGQTRQDIAGAGFAESGSALDILRSSAAQGAMTKAVLNNQGLITEAGYAEQAQSYRNMAAAAQVAIDADKEAATGAFISGGIKGIAALATLA